MLYGLKHYFRTVEPFFQYSYYSKVTHNMLGVFPISLVAATALEEGGGLITSGAIVKSVRPVTLFNPFFFQAVSYTHLTLPTIYSV